MEQLELNAIPKPRVRVLVNSAETGLTALSNGRPPCNGYWQVHIPGVVENKLFWYQADSQVWVTNKGLKFTHDSTVSRGWLWRGLTAPWPGGYPYRVAGAALARIRTIVPMTRRPSAGYH